MCAKLFSRSRHTYEWCKSKQVYNTNIVQLAWTCFFFLGKSGLGLLDLYWLDGFTLLSNLRQRNFKPARHESVGLITCLQIKEIVLKLKIPFQIFRLSNSAPFHLSINIHKVKENTRVHAKKIHRSIQKHFKKKMIWTNCNVLDDPFITKAKNATNFSWWLQQFIAGQSYH